MTQTTNSCEFHLIHSLEKVFPNSNSDLWTSYSKLSALQGDRLSFQIAYRTTEASITPLTISTVTELEHFQIRKVSYVPSLSPVNTAVDDNYLTTDAGLFPDLLDECNGTITATAQWQSLWIDVEPDTKEVGNYPINFLFHTIDGQSCGSISFSIEVIPVELPKQQLLHTEWIHTDCLANYYEVEPFSDQWWAITENFISHAAKHSINMILTPVLNPPLDTAYGQERTNVQLTDINYNQTTNKYEFNFDKLERWVFICRQAGIRNFEISHLFSQWGAAFAPNIYVNQYETYEEEVTIEEEVPLTETELAALKEELNKTNEESSIDAVQGDLLSSESSDTTPENEINIPKTKIITKTELVEKQRFLGTVKQFGWHTPSDSDQYIHFLEQFLPALTNQLVDLNIAAHTYFHISDEPNTDCLEHFRSIHNLVYNYLRGFRVIDAISDISYYKEGFISHPVAASDAIAPFLDAGIRDLWAYYCSSQSTKVSNRFFAMPSSRNRILGIQLFKYHIKGFLHWGYNFYNSYLSLAPINPYISTDADGTLPSGDAFLVYPGINQMPKDSIRLMVLEEAFFDIRALSLLESQIGYDAVIELIEKDIEPITFDSYPTNSDYLVQLRETVNQKIKEIYK